MFKVRWRVVVKRVRNFQSSVARGNEASAKLSKSGGAR